MYSLLYFDTEDFFSPPDAPVHRLPGQMADIMRRHGFTGCFHIHGEKARFMERHAQTEVIEAVRKHDVSLHYDRGSIHPTTAEEVSNLDWAQGVERVLFRETTGFQTLHRVFGKCSGLTQHGGTFAAPIVYAAGKLGYPMLYSPFRLPGRGAVWFCNNLLMAGAQSHEAIADGGSSQFDQLYRDTPAFEANLAKLEHYLAALSGITDYWACFGCHPVITVMERFPDSLNFAAGAAPPRREWRPPTMIAGVSIPTILANFERYIVALATNRNVTWTTVAGMDKLFGNRPVAVRDAHVLEGARQVLENKGPTYTSLLSAGELLYLLALRNLAPADTWDVPQAIGPTTAEGADDGGRIPPSGDLDQVSREIVDHVMACGALPAALSRRCGRIGPEVALILLACQATGRKPGDIAGWPPSVDAIPGVPTALANVAHYKNWPIHGPHYNQAGILTHVRLQAWTLKPAFTADKYPDDVTLGRHLNPMII